MPYFIPRQRFLRKVSENEESVLLNSLNFDDICHRFKITGMSATFQQHEEVQSTNLHVLPYDLQIV